MRGGESEKKKQSKDAGRDRKKRNKVRKGGETERKETK